MKIVADAQIPYVRDYFAACGELDLQLGRAITRASLGAAEILLVRSITQVNASLLAGSCVKFVGSITAGADHLDTTWLESAGIVWAVASGFNALPVADYVMSVIAALQRQQVLIKKKNRAAVIGVGHVGRLVAERLQQLHFDVVQCDPLRARVEPDFNSTALTELEDMDLISLHVPLTKTGDDPTFHFLTKKILKRQKPGCVLINAARGAVIDSDVLMQYGTHLHWCFDVWEHEPHLSKAILERALIATPHIAGYSVQSKRRGIEMIYALAKEKGMMTAALPFKSKMPSQQFILQQRHPSWQEVILEIFNPLLMTDKMRALLLQAADPAFLFDEMRHQFNERYEFAFAKIKVASLSEIDKKILQQWGIQIEATNA